MNDPHSEDRGPTRSSPGSAALMFGLLEAARSVEHRLEDGLASVGLSMAKQGVLTLLVEVGEPMALSELAAHQRCVRSNMTQLVDRLETEGFVRRVDDPADRRIVRAELTVEGRERQAAGVAEIERVRSEFVGALSAPDRAALERVLTALG